MTLRIPGPSTTADWLFLFMPLFKRRQGCFSSNVMSLFRTAGRFANCFDFQNRLSFLCALQRSVARIVCRTFIFSLSLTNAVTVSALVSASSTPMRSSPAAHLPAESRSAPPRPSAEISASPPSYGPPAQHRLFDCCV